MATEAKKRFIFLGGIPVFDYLIRVDMAEITKATEKKYMKIDKKILLPVGTIFKCSVTNINKAIYLNPMANVGVQNFNGVPYYAMELGGKYSEQYKFTLCADNKKTIFSELKQKFPEIINKESDLKLVEVRQPAKIQLGGNNKNLIDAITKLYSSTELGKKTRHISFEHLFFFDSKNPKYEMIKDFYQGLDVFIGDTQDLHVDNLIPRISYVLTIYEQNEGALDRIVLSNRTNEEIIPQRKLKERYFKLEYKLRKDQDFIETHLVISSLTNPEELGLISRILHTAYASEVTTYLCPTSTFFKCVDQLIDKGYYSIKKGQTFNLRKDFLYSAIIPFIQYIILNTDELAMLESTFTQKGASATTSTIVCKMNQGKKGENPRGGRILLTSGAKGARYTERLTPEQELRFWEKANMPKSKLSKFRFADRQILCGDDVVIKFLSTLGAGDTFTGIFIGLEALGWDGGHALRAATLGAQHFIKTGIRPTIRDIIATDEAHISMGTQTELYDIISHHISESGDPTRYGTISDTVITISTTQIHHPFREILGLEEGRVTTKPKAVTKPAVSR